MSEDTPEVMRAKLDAIKKVCDDVCDDKDLSALKLTNAVLAIRELLACRD